MTKHPILEVLNKIKWDTELRNKEVKIYFISRGAHQDIKIINFSPIYHLGKVFLDACDEGCIPYHRIVKILMEKVINV